MATTSTNKQPLFIDRVFHYVLNTTDLHNGQEGDDFLVSGSTSANVPLVDAISTDGAIVEDLYVISRGIQSTVNLYLSTARDFLRETQAQYIGSLSCTSTAREVTRWAEMPKTLAPVPQVDDEPKNTALYVPKGYALWAVRQGNGTLPEAPLVGCQGGWY